MRSLLRPGGSPAVGTVVGLGATLLVTGLFLAVRSDVSAAAPALALVLPVVVAGLIGGGRAAVVVAFGAALAFNVAFIHPYGTLKVDAVEDAVALFVFLAVALAIGALVGLEAARRRSAEQRADEIARLYEQLERVSAEREHLAAETARLAALEQVDEQRAALLRSVSHDLRTPLATIEAVASDLRDGVHSDPATPRELLGTVCDEAERLDRLVNNLLSLSRIEAGALRPDRQAVDLAELVGEAARRLKRVFEQVRLEIDVPPDLPFVDGDYSQLDQVVTNLLENAARHTPSGSTVRLTADATESDVTLAVQDKGVGVPPEEAERIFEPFRRGEGSASSGVGLAICKAVAEAHGGAVWVEETAGGGATFRVRLPVHGG